MNKTNAWHAELNYPGRYPEPESIFSIQSDDETEFIQRGSEKDRFPCPWTSIAIENCEASGHEVPRGSRIAGTRPGVTASTASKTYGETRIACPARIDP